VSTIISAFISYVTTAEIEIKLFQPLKEFSIISATLNTLKNIHELQ